MTDLLFAFVSILNVICCIVSGIMSFGHGASWRNTDGATANYHRALAFRWSLVFYVSISWIIANLVAK